MKGYVSGYNFDPRVRKGLELPESVGVFDTTLRDGEQTPGVSLMPEEKEAIAEQLSRLGVAVIEAGFPINSAQEKAIVRRIAGMGLEAEVCALARVKPGDLQACFDCNPDVVHAFISTSDIHIRDQMPGYTRERVREEAVRAVEMVKDAGFKCMYSPMDATRTELPYLIEVCKAVEEAGVDIINLPDTVGVITPPAMAYLVSKVREQVAVPIAVHCHNDLGLAVANTLAAVGAGASQVQVTVNGIGERTGNASLAETVFGLELGYGVKTGIRMDATLIETSRMVETFTGIPVAPNAPVVGINVHTHEAGIHAAGVRRGAHTFEAFNPEALGQKTEIAIGKHSGVHAVEEALERMGILASREQAAEITSRVKEVAAGRKKPIVPEYDLAAIAGDVLGQPMQRQPVRIKEFSVSSGKGKAPTAKVVLEVNGAARAAKAEGVGSVDAAFKAVIAAIGRPVQLTDYRLQGIRGGTEALADARITIKDEAGREFRGNAVHEDVVRASLYAGVNAINRMMVAEANGVKSVNAGSGAARDFAHLAADTEKGGERGRERGRLKN